MNNKELYDSLKGIFNEANDNRPIKWRYGQAVFNYALDKFPDIVESLRGSDIDCFHNNDKVSKFLAVIYYKYDCK